MLSRTVSLIPILLLPANHFIWQSIEFAQVGDDLKAQKFLEELDNHPVIGSLVDCTSNFEAEQAEMMRKSGVNLDPSMWIVKLLMGPIDTSYDTKGKFFLSFFCRWWEKVFEQPLHPEWVVLAFWLISLCRRIYILRSEI